MHQSVKLTGAIWLLQLGNLFPSHLCTDVTRVKPWPGFEPGPEHERQTTYQLSYPRLPLLPLFYQLLNTRNI